MAVAQRENVFEKNPKLLKYMRAMIENTSAIKIFRTWAHDILKNFVTELPNTP